jgi:hypothetical protein
MLRISTPHFARLEIPPKTEPIPRDVLEPPLSASGMTLQYVLAVLYSSEFQALESRNIQVVFRSEFAETEISRISSTLDIAKIFDIHADNVRQIQRTADMKWKNLYRSLILDLEQETNIVHFIYERPESPNYVVQRDILNFGEAKFTKILRYGEMCEFSHHHKSDVCQVTATSQEQVRLQVRPCYLHDDLSLITKVMPIVQTELIFNLDKTGLSDWDWKRKPALVRAVEEDSAFHHPIGPLITTFSYAA